MVQEDKKGFSFKVLERIDNLLRSIPSSILLKELMRREENNFDESISIEPKAVIYSVAGTVSKVESINLLGGRLPGYNVMIQLDTDELKAIGIHQSRRTIHYYYPMTLIGPSFKEGDRVVVNIYDKVTTWPPVSFDVEHSIYKQ